MNTTMTVTRGLQATDDATCSRPNADRRLLSGEVQLPAALQSATPPHKDLYGDELIWLGAFSEMTEINVPWI